MSNIVKAGILIGVLCGIWTFIMGFTGWYKDPVMLNMFWVVIPIQIIVMIWGFRKTAAEGRTYARQLGAGSLMSVIGGAILIVTSLIFTTVLFPNYFEEIRLVQEELLRNAGKSEAEIKMTIEAAAATQTPMMQAMFGFIGTAVTGFICSMIIGAFVRSKAQPA